MKGSLSLSARCAVAAVSLRNAFGSRQPQLSLITDFGSGDEAVYAIRSAASHVNPEATAVDICHDVPIGNILLGAWRLNRAVSLPTERKGTAYVAVVDPGVGSRRKNIAVQTEDGKFLVGPDNGVLSLAFASRGVSRAVEIENPELTLLHFAQSRTFHGKDVFAPAAAHLLRGVPLREFGRELSVSELARITISAESSERSRAGCLVDIDGFGSIRTNVPNHVPESFIGRGAEFEISGLPKPVGGRAKVVRTFAEAGKGETVFVLSSTGCLDLAVNLGSASEKLGIGGADIRLDESLRPALKVRLEFS
ncbi:MAG TPA: SAM-dependent chlorinase/fluorinase [Candidatus Bilamarchaeum sp.]|nr:SAM-dependent chlorinase/fluorinase [Candidatus Bilamarchaeum sp.]